MKWPKQLFRHGRYDDLSVSIQEHLEEKIDELMDEGLSREEAEHAARREFGNVALLEERSREVWQWPTLESIWADLKYGLRQLRKSPGFTIVAILILGLGIGANTAIFTLVHAVLIKDLPVANPKTLVKLGDRDDCCVGYGVPNDGDYSLFSTDGWKQLRKNAPEFQDLAAMQSGFGYQPVVVRRDGTPETAHSAVGEFVSGNYFRTFGLKATAGRLFSDADDIEGAPFTAVMSHETWKNNYSADPSVVGSTFFVNTKPITIIGIAPKDFYGDRLSSTPPDFYLPIQSMPALANAPYVHDPDAKWLDIIGRVKPGVSLPQLQTKLSGLLRQALAPIHAFASLDKKALLPKVHVVLTAGGAGIQEMRDQYAWNLKLLMATSGLVLLIACANIANLLLVRGTARKTEMSLRIALGAIRSRLIRQLLTESVVLAFIAGIVGIAVAYGSTRILLLFAFPRATELPIHANPSPAVLSFACCLSLLTAILFGIAPALIAAKAEPTDVFRAGSRMTAGGTTLLQRGLIVTQTALSVVLLVVAGLFIQSLNKLEHADLKLETKNRYIIHFDPQAAGYLPHQAGDLYRMIEERFHAIPGVQKVGISTYTPMEDRNDGWSVQVQGHADLNVHASDVKVNAEYFDSVGTHVQLGRGIGMEDTPSSTTVAVVNQSFVKKLFKPGENPIGHHFGTGIRSAGDYEIVGVVDDTAYTSARWKDHAMYFMPILQRPASDKGTPIDEDYTLYAETIVLETSRPIDNMESLARRTLSETNPNLAVVRFQPFDQQIADQFADDRMIARLTMLFGGLALLLATIGLYGVTAYTVARRTGEIGIRMALGAERAAVVAMIMKDAVSQTALGLAIGIPMAFLCVGFIKAQLYDVSGVDVELLTIAILVLTVATFIAGFIPSRRAASIDPARTLRIE